MTNIQIDMDNNLNCSKELKELQENPMFKFSMSSESVSEFRVQSSKFNNRGYMKLYEKFTRLYQ